MDSYSLNQVQQFLLDCAIRDGKENEASSSSSFSAMRSQRLKVMTAATSGPSSLDTTSLQYFITATGLAEGVEVEGGRGDYSRNVGRAPMPASRGVKLLMNKGGASGGGGGGGGGGGEGEVDGNASESEAHNPSRAHTHPVEAHTEPWEALVQPFGTLFGTKK
jgi:hypothetical protein